MSAESIRLFKEDRAVLDADNSFGGELTQREIIDARHHLGAVFADKAYDSEAVRLLAEEDIIGRVVDAYLLGNHRYGNRSSSNRRQAASVLTGIALGATRKAPAPTYSGTIFEHKTILDGEYGTSSFRGEIERFRDLRKNGASRIFESGHVNLSEAGRYYDLLRSTPIAIIGAGAAGILTARSLVEMGFRNIDIIDKRGDVGGIWNQPNVRNGSKNNPFSLGFDLVHTPAASNYGYRDLIGSGDHILDYIQNVSTGSLLNPQGTGQKPLRITKGIVREIEPGDLNHHVLVDVDGKEELREYPIVIYAPGLGKPLDVSSAAHMQTEAKRGEAGIRWQQQLSDEKLRALEGKRLVFVGLGNSTAEMVGQLQDYEIRTGRTVDYRILTHYPHEMIENPHDDFGPHDRLYRDTSKPQLTKLAGDLDHIDDMFTTARERGKIVSDVTKWNVERGRLVAETADGTQTIIPYDQLYTLIGYGQDEKTLSSVGMTAIEQRTGSVALDFDGEVQRNPGAVGRERIYPGYFGIGPIAKHRHNPNAIVIPGIQYQLNDMITSVLLRTAEFAIKHPVELADARDRFDQNLEGTRHPAENLSTRIGNDIDHLELSLSALAKVGRRPRFEPEKFISNDINESPNNYF